MPPKAAARGKRLESLSRDPSDRVPRRLRSGLESSTRPEVPPSSSSDPPPSSWFISTNALKRYHDRFSKATLASGKTIDLLSFDALYFHLFEKFQKLGWHQFVSLDEPIFPRLVRVFYSNMSYSSDTHTIRSVVKGRQITIDTSILSLIFGIPDRGDEIITKNTWPVGLTGLDVLSDLCGRHIAFEPEKLSVSMVNLEMRLISWVCSNILMPRAGCHSEFTRVDALIMYHVKHGHQINLPGLILNHMHSQWSHLKKGSLPYGLILTRVFRHFGVDLSGESSESLIPSHKYSIASLTPVLKYKWDAHRAAYYVKSGELEARYYTRDTSELYLPTGYSGPPEYVPLYRSDGSAVHPDAIPSDLPPPSDDPLAFDPTLLGEDLPPPPPPPPAAPSAPAAASSSASSPDILGYLERLSSQMTSLQQYTESRFTQLQGSMDYLTERVDMIQDDLGKLTVETREYFRRDPDDIDTD